MSAVKNASFASLAGLLMLLPSCFEPNPAPADDTSASGTSTGGQTSGLETGPTTTSPPTTSADTDATSTGEPTTTAIDTDADTEPGATGSDGSDSGSTTDIEPTTAGDDTGSTSTGVAEVCEDGYRCIDAVPEGWNGPVARRTLDIEDDIPPCGGTDYIDLQVADGFGALTAPPFECECSCDSGPVGCSGVADVFLTDEVPDDNPFSPCTFAYDYEEQVGSGAPQAVSLTMNDIRGFNVENPTSNLVGSCDPVEDFTETPAAFGERTIACGTFDTESGGCGDGLCVPDPAAPYDAPVCIWTEGNVECPAGFSERTVLHQSITDDRSCTSCACGDAAGSCDNPSFEVSAICEFVIGSAPFECGLTASYDLASAGFCETLRNDDFIEPCDGFCLAQDVTELQDFTYNAGTPDSQCAPSGGAPTGTAGGGDALTFCCDSGS